MNTQELNELSEDEFNALSPDELRERAEKSAEQSEELLDDSDEDQDSDKADEHEDEQLDPDDSDEDAEDSEEEESEEVDDPEPADDADKSTVTTKVKASKQDKQEAEVVDNVVTPSMDPQEFMTAVTSAFKASGQEYSFSDPKEIISLMQKGVHFTKKLQSITHLQGLNEVLTQNGLTDPKELAFLIDVKNGKPEAIAKLIQEHQLDTYDLDEERASTYQQSAVDITANAKAVALKELALDNANDENFNQVTQDILKWDEASKEYLVNNLSSIEALRDQKADGSYDKIMHELNRRNVVNPSTLPIMQQYISIGEELLGARGSAQNTQTQQPKPPVTERVIVKRGNVEEQRKRVAPTKSGSGKRKTLAVRTPEDINKLSDEDFAKLSLDELRKIK